MTTVVRAAFGCAVLVHLAVLYAPTTPGVPGGLRLDLVVHVAVFAAVVWTGRLAGLPRAPLVVVAALHAGVSELVQHVALAGRTGDLGDVAADLVGVGLGAVLPLAGRR